MSLRAKCAIAGLGATRMGKNYDHSHALGFAIEAVDLAIEDAGLSRSDIDLLLQVTPGFTSNPTGQHRRRPAIPLFMWDMTPICEGVIQVRGDGGRRQVPKHDIALVSGNGGILSTHSTLVLVASA